MDPTQILFSRKAKKDISAFLRSWRVKIMRGCKRSLFDLLIVMRLCLSICSAIMTSLLIQVGEPCLRMTQETHAYVPVVVSPPWQDHISCFDDSMIDTWRFSREFASRVDHWLRQLKWLVNDEQYVSCLELYIDFALFIRTYSPARFRSKGVHSRAKIKYKMRDTDIALDYAEHSLALQHGVWVQFIRWIFKQERTVFPGALVSRKKTLHSVGYSIPCVSLDVRPELTCGHAAGLELWKYFHHSGGAVRSLQRVWRFNRITMVDG